MPDMTGTWRHCTAAAVEGVSNARDQRWAHLCRDHGHQLELAARIESPDWSAWRLFRMSIEARGGWLAAAKGRLR